MNKHVVPENLIKAAELLKEYVDDRAATPGPKGPPGAKGDPGEPRPLFYYLDSPMQDMGYAITVPADGDFYEINPSYVPGPGAEYFQKLNLVPQVGDLIVFYNLVRFGVVVDMDNNVLICLTTPSPSIDMTETESALINPNNYPEGIKIFIFED